MYRASQKEKGHKDLSNVGGFKNGKGNTTAKGSNDVSEISDLGIPPVYDLLYLNRVKPVTTNAQNITNVSFLSEMQMRHLYLVDS